MPRDANGNTQPLPGTIVTAGDTVLPSQHNPALQDLYAMMTQSLSRDGQGGMRADLNMGGFRVTNAAPGTSPNDLATVSQALGGGLPLGTIIDWAGGAVPPPGWLFPVGQAISRTQYAEYFAMVGGSFGAGDGSTTFNIIDVRGCVLVAPDNLGGASSNRLTWFFGAVANAVNGLLGTAAHAITPAEMASHNHGGQTSSPGPHQHSLTLNVTGSLGASSSAFVVGPAQFTQTYLTNIDGPHVHGISPDGGNNAHTNVQPTRIVRKIIKVANA